MDSPDESLSNSNETDKINLVNPQDTSNTNSEYPTNGISLRFTKRTMTLSKTTIKQEEPEADHDYLYDEAIKAPFKSTSNIVQKAFKIFDDLRRNNILCDVVLKAGNVEINAHKVILASCSPYFHAMFSGNMCESKAPLVILNDVNGEALQKLINFIYTCEIHVTEENVQILLPTANLLQLNEVKDACCDFLQYQLHPSNCLGIQRFADLHSCKDLLLYSKQYSETHFCEILNQDEFVKLPIDHLENLISSSTLSAKEEDVFDAVRKWIKYRLSVRQQYTQRLFSHVRFPLLSKEFLVKLPDEDEFIKTNDACKDFLINGLRFHLVPNEERILYESLQTTPRVPAINPRILMVIGGQAPKAVRSVEEYDFKSEQWRQVTELPGRRCRCGAVLNKGLVYVIGGFNGSLRVRTVETYDPVKDRWESVCQMEARRSTLGVAVLDGLIYAVGGFDGAQGLSTAEVYDPVNDIWRNIASMSLRRSSVGLAVLNGHLYVVGGYDGLDRECLSSVECYSPKKDVWAFVASMSCKRSGAAVGTLDGYLYAIGGHDGPNIRNTVERYSPETERWAPVANMNYNRRNAGVVTHNGLIYVVGGDDGSSNLSSVEYYNPVTDSWSLLNSNMMIGRSYAAVVLLPSDKKLDYMFPSSHLVQLVK